MPGAFWLGVAHGLTGAVSVPAFGRAAGVTFAPGWLPGGAFGGLSAAAGSLVRFCGDVSLGEGAATGGALGCAAPVAVTGGACGAGVAIGPAAETFFDCKSCIASVIAR